MWPSNDGAFVIGSPRGKGSLFVPFFFLLCQHSNPTWHHHRPRTCTTTFCPSVAFKLLCATGHEGSASHQKGTGEASHSQARGALYVVCVCAVCMGSHGIARLSAFPLGADSLCYAAKVCYTLRLRNGYTGWVMMPAVPGTYPVRCDEHREQQSGRRD